MIWNEIVSAVCIGLSTMVFCVSMQMQSKTKLMAIQIISSIFYISSYFFVITVTASALSGAIIASVEFLRLIVYYLIEKSKRYNTPNINLMIGIIFSVIVAICTALSWAGWISGLPLIASVIISMALGFQRIVYLKWAFLVNAMLIFVYLLLMGLWFNASAQFVVMIFIAFSLIKYLIKRKKYVQIV